MRLSVNYEKNYMGVIFTYHKILSGEDTIEANNKIYASPHADKYRYCIIDLRDIDAVEISPEQMSLLAQQDREEAVKNQGLKVAIVVDNDLVQGVASFYSLYVNNPSVEAKMFKSLDRARAWIDALIADGSIPC